MEIIKRNVSKPWALSMVGYNRYSLSKMFSSKGQIRYSSVLFTGAELASLARLLCYFKDFRIEFEKANKERLESKKDEK